MCGPFEGWGKSVGGEEEQGEDEEHGGVGGDGGPVRDDGDGGLESDDRAEKDSEKVLSVALSGRTLIETDVHYVSILYCLVSEVHGLRILSSKLFFTNFK